ncbi:MAG: PKD domain-containing protein [Bacteroidia bacterium]|nr:PKD domain-containing protein [Bacteroidia bacterium]
MKPLITLLAFMPALCFGQWTQLGNAINGQAAGDNCGYSTAISADGTIVAMGANFNDNGGGAAGQVRVFGFSNGVWSQIGSDLNGETGGDQTGQSVSLSADGAVVAIGEPLNNDLGFTSGQVRVFKNLNNTWSQVGQDLYGQNSTASAGTSVDLSADGNTVAFGAPNTVVSPFPSFTGNVEVYQLQGNSWVQKGGDIEGDGTIIKFGQSVSLSDDGNIIAIGQSGDPSNLTPPDTGRVKVYQFVNNQWVQLGNTIKGTASQDEFGFRVSLSSSGTILAIGTFGKGEVKVFELINGTWSQVGSTLVGNNPGDRFGFSLSLSSSGSFLAVGARFITLGNNQPGSAYIFENQGGNWVQVGSQIFGVAPGDQAGFSVAISQDGSRVAVSSIGNDAAGNNAGQVRVFENLSLCTADAGYAASGTEFTFSFTSTATNADSVSYDFGDGTTSTAPDPTHVYAAAGTYTVCQIAYGSCGNDTSCTTVNAICNTPVAGFTAEANELVITLTSTASTADSLFYTYGDGTTGTDATHTYAQPGTYEVCQIATRSCGSDTLCRSVTVRCVPASSEVSFQVNTFSSVTFTSGATNADSIRFVYGTTAFSTSSPWTYDFGASGTFTVSLIAYSKCGNDTSTVQVTVIGTSVSDLLDASSLLLFPNPAVREVTLSFTLHKAADLQVDLVDMQGRTVFSQAYARAVGAFQTSLSLPGLASGIYLVQIRIEDALVTRKLRVE